MSIIRWTLFILFWGAIVAFLHYTLPQHDVVRITDTENRRVDPGINSWFWTNTAPGSDMTAGNRDVFFISAVRTNGSVIVYRNEDTGWSWPPYFKFNASNLQAQAADLHSDASDPRWVMIRHYGWRNELFTIFPNATALWEVGSPDARVFNWRMLAFLVGIGAVVWMIYVRLRRFWARRVDPVLEDMGDGLADASDAVGERTNRFKRWLRGV